MLLMKTAAILYYEEHNDSKNYKVIYNFISLKYKKRERENLSSSPFAFMRK